MLDVSNDNVIKQIQIGKKKANALFDTGSIYNAMNKSTLGVLTQSSLDYALMESNFCLSGFGPNRSNDKIKPIGNINFAIYINDNKFELTFHVVPDDCINVNIVLGKLRCLQADVLYNFS